MDNIYKVLEALDQVETKTEGYLPAEHKMASTGTNLGSKSEKKHPAKDHFVGESDDEEIEEARGRLQGTDRQNDDWEPAEDEPSSQKGRYDRNPTDYSDRGEEYVKGRKEYFDDPMNKNHYEGVEEANVQVDSIGNKTIVKDPGGQGIEFDDPELAQQFLSGMKEEVYQEYSPQFESHMKKINEDITVTQSDPMNPEGENVTVTSNVNNIDALQGLLSNAGLGNSASMEPYVPGDTSMDSPTMGMGDMGMGDMDMVGDSPTGDLGMDAEMPDPDLGMGDDDMSTFMSIVDQGNEPEADLAMEPEMGDEMGMEPEVEPAMGDEMGMEPEVDVDMELDDSWEPDMSEFEGYDPLQSFEEERDIELANTPDETLGTTDTMLNKLSGGLNGPKTQYDKGYEGDNIRAVREGDDEDCDDEEEEYKEQVDETSSFLNLYKVFNGK